MHLFLRNFVSKLLLAACCYLKFSLNLHNVLPKTVWGICLCLLQTKSLLKGRQILFIRNKSFPFPYRTTIAKTSCILSFSNTCKNLNIMLKESIKRHFPFVCKGRSLDKIFADIEDLCTLLLAPNLHYLLSILHIIRSYSSIMNWQKVHYKVKHYIYMMWSYSNSTGSKTCTANLSYYRSTSFLACFLQAAKNSWNILRDKITWKILIHTCLIKITNRKICQI